MAGVSSSSAACRATAAAQVSSWGRRGGLDRGGSSSAAASRQTPRFRRAAGLGAWRHLAPAPRAPPPSPHVLLDKAEAERNVAHRALGGGAEEGSGDAEPMTMLANAALYAAAAATGLSHTTTTASSPSSTTTTTAPGVAAVPSPPPFVPTPELLRLCEPLNAAAASSAEDVGAVGATSKKKQSLKVALLLSGGVDSSVALTLLQAAGMALHSSTFQLNLSTSRGVLSSLKPHPTHPKKSAYVELRSGLVSAPGSRARLHGVLPADLVPGGLPQLLGPVPVGGEA